MAELCRHCGGPILRVVGSRPRTYCTPRCRTQYRLAQRRAVSAAAGAFLDAVTKGNGGPDFPHHRSRAEQAAYEARVAEAKRNLEAVNPAAWRLFGHGQP